SPTTALNRLKLAASFFLTIPGPKMIWQFGELGYDIPINYNGRTGNKPILWDYANDPERKKVYKTFQALLNLRRSSPAFTSLQSEVKTDLATSVKIITIQHPELDVVISGNFDVNESDTQPHFTRSGKWYDYFTGDSVTISDLDTVWTLKPGEFNIFTTQKFETPEEDILSYVNQPDISEISAQVPKFFPNYPNPFQSETRIIYHLPVSTPVTLDVFDIIGRKVRTLV